MWFLLCRAKHMLSSLHHSEGARHLANKHAQRLFACRIETDDCCCRTKSKSAILKIYHCYVPLPDKGLNTTYNDREMCN